MVLQAKESDLGHKTINIHSLQKKGHNVYFISTITDFQIGSRHLSLLRNNNWNIAVSTSLKPASLA